MGCAFVDERARQTYGTNEPRATESAAEGLRARLAPPSACLGKGMRHVEARH